MPRRSIAALVTIGATILALALTGCTPPKPAPTATATRTAIPTVAPSGDGTLRIGTLFPMTGEAAASGAAQVAGTELAAREIGEQGGVFGKPLELIHRNSAGDQAAAVADLLARGVDVVLWDASGAPPEPVAASVDAAGVALLPLADFVKDGAPLAADEAFAARLRTADPGLADPAGGAEAYDGVVSTALAATVAGDDGGASVEAGWKTLAAGTTPCTSWGECLAALADAQKIDFRGVTGRRS